MITTLDCDKVILTEFSIIFMSDAENLQYGKEWEFMVTEKFGKLYTLFLTVKVNIIDKVFMIGRKVVEGGFKTFLRILFDEHFGQWNYVAVSQHG